MMSGDQGEGEFLGRFKDNAAAGGLPLAVRPEMPYAFNKSVQRGDQS
jgi:hypothetical protein